MYLTLSFKTVNLLLLPYLDIDIVESWTYKLEGIWFLNITIQSEDEKQPRTNECIIP